MKEYVELSTLQVSTAASLILVNAVISLALRLRLERSLLIASVRTILQLLLIGLVLHWVFQVEEIVVVISLLAIMTGIAGYTAFTRTSHAYAGMLLDSMVAVWASSWFVLAFAMVAVLQGARSWHDPQYAIPLLGMILGNTLNGITLGLAGVLEGFRSGRDQVETLLTLGATRWEAAREVIQKALTTAMTPIINSMMVVGIVSLPGMMTGQLLSGVEPIQAVKYQIVIMFLIASATALGSVGVVLLAYRRLFSRQHQFRYDAIQSRK
ncbi:MAG: iron export ABC transporter permease subunit FetB [Planctomycetaceae bacterium]|nr:iron export ABC transporter permease subunit FetB [Planctomycetales bacterium]MCB9873517.1 iron export ABC transporter permease subunit FetB [Planctomycetaceae bacterium]MCB9940427.1 iron export ABC transporter permease subunit FetB [Planctomycetaceae bacterium]